MSEKVSTPYISCTNQVDCEKRIVQIPWFMVKLKFAPQIVHNTYQSLVDPRNTQILKRSLGISKGGGNCVAFKEL